MKTRIIDINSLNQADYNPRIELKEGMAEWNALNNSLQKFGLVVPIIINEKNNTIISGHQRISALKAQGETQAEAVVLNLDENNEKQLNIALNKIQGKWDFDKLEQMLENMTEEEKKYTGFLESRFEQIDKVVEIGEEIETKKETKEKPFYIYVSFDNKEDVIPWAEKNGIKTQNIKDGAVFEMEAI